MKEESYKRAGEIKDRLLQLEIHKKELSKNHFIGSSGTLIYQFNSSRDKIKLFPINIPENFFKDYMDSVEKEMQDLEEEFKNL